MWHRTTGEILSEVLMRWVDHAERLNFCRGKENVWHHIAKAFELQLSFLFDTFKPLSLSEMRVKVIAAVTLVL
jgi:hypothetical protein